jgi:transforming growth factor-beta-induced protein
MKNLRTLTLLFVSLFVISSCDDDDSTTTSEPQTIAEIAAGDSNFSTLVSALERTGLTSVLNGAGTYTVFAPTNDAFDALGVDLTTLSDNALTEILLYHVLGAEVFAGDIAEGQTYVSTAATTGPDNSQLSMLIEKGSTVVINGSINVTSADLDASNGVIHVIDNVILPLDVVGHALANDSFTELVGALTAADLVVTLQSDGPFTVFAPVNSAFEAISDVVSGLSTEQLSNVLTYHVVSPANVLSSQLSDGQVVTALNEGSFTINLASAVTITDANDNNISIVLTDVQAKNGVIHVLDAVLLP